MDYVLLLLVLHAYIKYISYVTLSVFDSPHLCLCTYLYICTRTRQLSLIVARQHLFSKPSFNDDFEVSATTAADNSSGDYDDGQYGASSCCWARSAAIPDTAKEVICESAMRLLSASEAPIRNATVYI